MKKLLGIFAAGLLVLGANTATAAPVATAASLTLTITGIGSITITGAGTVNVSGSTVNVGANLVVQGAPIVVAVTSTSAVQSITAISIANAAGTFSQNGVTNQAAGEICVGVTSGVACNAGGNVGGAMGLVGIINVRVNGFVNVPVNLSTANIGQGGTFATGGGSIAGDAGVWTTGTAVVNVNTTVTTPNGFIFTTTVPVPGFGSGSPLTLVTPTFVNAFGGLATLPLFTAFNMSAVTIPEPGTLLLLGSGIAGLLLVGRSRK